MENDAIRLANQALWLVLVLSGPPVVAATIVGLFIAIIQSATQLQEQTLQYAFKFFAVVLTIFITGGFITNTLLQFANDIFLNFPSLIRP